MNALFVLNEIKKLFTAQGAFDVEVGVYEGLQSGVTDTYSLQIYPLCLREETRADNLLACTDVWRLTGAVKKAGGQTLLSALDFALRVKAILDGADLGEDFTCALTPQTAFAYEDEASWTFHIQLEIKYLRRIK